MYQLRNVVQKILEQFQIILKSHQTIFTLKSGAQKLGKISDHLKITFRYINSEILCTMLLNFFLKKWCPMWMNLVVKKQHNIDNWIYPSQFTLLYYQWAQKISM